MPAEARAEKIVRDHMGMVTGSADYTALVEAIRDALDAAERERDAAVAARNRALDDGIEERGIRQRAQLRADAAEARLAETPETVARVATAIRDATPVVQVPRMFRCVPWNDTSESEREWYRGLAHAALRALREG